jgi:membrane associated rhomboid family serine protease
VARFYYCATLSGAQVLFCPPTKGRRSEWGRYPSRTVPFITLGGFVALQGTRIFLVVSLWIILLSGAALWLLGRSTYHVGASSVLFGYFGYLVALGGYERSVTALLVALLTLGLYGGIVWGLLPTRPFISWEGHLFGLLAGVLVARLATPRQRDTSISSPMVR